MTKDRGSAVTRARPLHKVAESGAVEHVVPEDQGTRLTVDEFFADEKHPAIPSGSG